VVVGLVDDGGAGVERRSERPARVAQRRPDRVQVGDRRADAGAAELGGDVGDRPPGGLAVLDQRVERVALLELEAANAGRVKAALG